MKMNSPENVEALKTAELAWKVIEEHTSDLLYVPEHNGKRRTKRTQNTSFTKKKRSGMRKTVEFIQDGDRKMSKANEVLSVFTQRLKNKYAEQIKNVPYMDFIHKNIKTNINEIAKQYFEAPISLGELALALKWMKKGKTPGINGFSVEFLISFWKESGILLYQAYKHSLSNETNRMTHREGMITMIPKAGKYQNSLKGKVAPS